MICIYCQTGKTKVIDSRDSVGRTERRIECRSCRRRFNTVEEHREPKSCGRQSREQDDRPACRYNSGVICQKHSGCETCGWYPNRIAKGARIID